MITHGDFRGTHRAQVIDYENAGPALDDVIKTVADTFGTDPVIKAIYIYPKALGIDAVDPDHPDRIVGFRASINGVYRAGSPVPDSPLEPPPGRFAINAVDWQLLPKLVDASRDRLRLPDGRISGISIKKLDNSVTGPTLRWQITIEDGSANGLVEFDAKGTVLHVLFPQGREPVFEMFDAASAAMVFEAASHAFNEHVSTLELRFEPHEAQLALQDPKKPGGAVVFQYGARGLSRSLISAQDRPRTADWFFDLALMQPVAAQWGQLQQDTLTRLGLAAGQVDRITVSKQKSRLPQNDRVLIVVEASAGGRKGAVAYDLDRKVVDIARP
jgi:hypothetical protein